MFERAVAEAPKRVDVLFADAVDGRKGEPRLFFEFQNLALGVDVDLPTAELTRKPHVLSAAADRLAELIVGHDQLHGEGLLVDEDLRNLGRLNGIAHKTRRIFAVGHDVDFLAAQFLDDRLDAGALHTDAGADRIDVGIAAGNRDLRPAAGLAGGCFDTNDALVDFGNLHLEQLDQQRRRCTRQHNLRPAGVALDVEHIRLNALTGTIGLAANLLTER